MALLNNDGCQDEIGPNSSNFIAFDVLLELGNQIMWTVFLFVCWSLSR